MIKRPSSTERFRYLTQRSAPSTVSIVTKPKPRDSLVRGSTITWHSETFPSLLKYFSRSLLLTRVDKPVTYKLFPGLLESKSWLLERLLDLDRDGVIDLLRLLGGGVTDREVYLKKAIHCWKGKKVDTEGTINCTSDFESCLPHFFCLRHL